MIKHIQTIRRQQPTDCLSVFDHFVKLAIKGLSCQLNIKIDSKITVSKIANKRKKRW